MLYTRESTLDINFDKVVLSRVKSKVTYAVIYSNIIHSQFFFKVLCAVN